MFEKLILNKGDDSENVIDNCKRKATHITYILSYLSGKSDNPESTAVTPTRSNRNKRKKVSWSNKDEFINNDNNSNDRDTKMGDNKDKIDTHPRFLEPIEPSAINEAWSAAYNDVSHEGNNKDEEDLW